MARVIGRNSSPELVAALQYALSQAGFNPGPIDGTFGDQTERAVRSFQKANSLSVDGDPGPQTLGALASKTTFSGNQPRPRPQALTMPGVSARINGMGTPNAAALKQIGPSQATIGRPTMTGAFGPPTPSGQASGRPISMMEFDPLRGNSGRGVGNTQLDLAGPFGSPAAPPPPNVIKQIYDRLGGFDGRQGAPSVSDMVRGNSLLSTAGGVPRATPVAGQPTAAQLGQLAPAPRITVPAGRGGGGAAGRATSAPYGWTTPTDNRGALSQYSSNEVVGPNHVIWNDVHPDLRSQKSSILGHSGTGTATDKIAAGALIAADAVFRAAEAEGVKMTVAPGGGSNQHSKNHGKGGIGESIDIKPVGGWSGQAEKYALIAAAAGANRLGVPLATSSTGLHIQVSKGAGLTGRPTTTWSYPQTAVANQAVLTALQTGNFGVVQGRPLEAQRYAGRSNTYPSAEELGIISARRFDGAPTGAAIRPPTPPTPRTAYANMAPNQGAALRPPTAPTPSTAYQAPTVARSGSPNAAAANAARLLNNSNFGVAAPRAPGSGGTSVIGGTPAPRPSSPNASAAAAFARANEKDIWGPMASRPSSTLGMPGALPTPQQARSLTMPTVPGATPRPVQTAQILKPTLVRTTPISLSLPPTLSGMTGTAANAGKAKDDYLGPPTIAPPPLPTPTARLPQSRPTPAPVRSTPSLPTNFNRQVAELQSMLNLAGVRDFTGSALKVDGLMGPRTQSAVIAAQGGMARPSVSAPRVSVPASRSDSSASRGGSINPASGAPRGSISGSVGGSGRVTTGAMR